MSGGKAVITKADIEGHENSLHKAMRIWTARRGAPCMYQTWQSVYYALIREHEFVDEEAVPSEGKQGVSARIKDKYETVMLEMFGPNFRVDAAKANREQQFVGGEEPPAGSTARPQPTTPLPASITLGIVTQPASSSSQDGSSASGALSLRARGALPTVPEETVTTAETSRDAGGSQATQQFVIHSPRPNGKQTGSPPAGDEQEKSLSPPGLDSPDYLYTSAEVQEMYEKESGTSDGTSVADERSEAMAARLKTLALSKFTPRVQGRKSRR